MVNMQTTNNNKTQTQPFCGFYISAPSSSSSSLALKCIFLNSRLLMEGQDKEAGGRSLAGRKQGPESQVMPPASVMHPALLRVLQGRKGLGLSTCPGGGHRANVGVVGVLAELRVVSGACRMEFGTLHVRIPLTPPTAWHLQAPTLRLVGSASPQGAQILAVLCYSGSFS